MLGVKRSGWGWVGENCRGGIRGQYDQSRLYACIKFSKIKINKKTSFPDLPYPWASNKYHLCFSLLFYK